MKPEKPGCKWWFLVALAVLVLPGCGGREEKEPVLETPKENEVGISPMYVYIDGKRVDSRLVEWDCSTGKCVLKSKDQKEVKKK